MRIAILVNRSAGRGRGERAARDIADALARRGHEPDLAPLDRAPAASRADLVVAVGGDGTLRTAARLALDAGAAVYHLPMGNENLFARHFGMSRAPDRLLAALECPRTVAMDVGVLARGGGRELWTIMCGVGFDAAVIRRLHRRRTGPLGRFAYARASLAESLRPALGPLSVTVDGQALVEHRRGQVIVANLPEYGGRLDPARDATPGDGLLDVIFLPSRTAVGLAAWGVLIRARRAIVAHGGCVARGRAVEVSGSAPVQIDGEPAGVLDASTSEPLRAQVQPGALRVLLPASDDQRRRTTRPATITASIGSPPNSIAS